MPASAPIIPFRRAGQFSPGRAVRPADRLARFLDGLERRRRFGAAGRAWRAEYLRRTYGCGALSALRAIGGRGRRGGRPARFAPAALEANWLLPAWDARELLAALRPHSRLGVVTNCSRALGHRAAALLGVDWDVVVTSEEAGYYKPDPRPSTAGAAGRNRVRRLRRWLRLRSVRHQPRGLDLLAQPGRPGAAARRARAGTPMARRRLAEALPWLARFGA